MEKGLHKRVVIHPLGSVHALNNAELGQSFSERKAGVFNATVGMKYQSWFGLPSAHHWARRCSALGLQPKLIAAQFVTPFRKSRATKNDRNDAESIATAARQGNMRFVPIKTLDQQTRLCWHRVREADQT